MYYLFYIFSKYSFYKISKEKFKSYDTFVKDLFKQIKMTEEDETRKIC
jgi:hypothetical protein